MYFVDVVAGEITAVAEDGNSFESLLLDTQFVTERLFPSRIIEFRNAGMTLAPRQVYSHRTPLILGGEDDIENTETSDASVHISIQGQIHQQVKDLPTGTQIGNVKID